MAIGSIFHSRAKRRTPSPIEVWRAGFCVIANLLSSGRKVEKWKQGINAMDIVVLGIGILFFVLSFAYIKACDIL
ncbi:hypothetical protein X740_18770 [Mesorhizobium sp. LNHC221B00]|nr:hypothetical protein X740_18770 [Mesorhizobium sp. LNHC221B00]